jgi:flagellar hook protein FlgE
MGLTTFSTGLSGLSTNSQALSVIGNNLANLNTVGYKASDISFTDVLGQTFSTPGTAASGNTGEIGLGAQVGSIRQIFTQGSLQTTNNPLDVAIQGQGFLVVNNSSGQFYTRAGNLHLDANGNLVTAGGANVQGYSSNPKTGQIDPNLGLASIKMPSGLNSPVTTSQFELAMNLDAGAANASQFTTSIQVYDSLGKAHTATLTMQKSIAAGASPTTSWKFDITIPNNEIAGVAATDTKQYSLITGTTVSGAPTAGTLLFDNTGTLTSAWLGAAPGTTPALANLTIPGTGVTMPTLGNGATLSSAMTWKLLSDQGTPDVTGFGSASTVTANTQNGSAAGSLNNLSIGPDGTISAIFSNGRTVDVAQMALAQFSNVNGLVGQGDGLYAETTASGASLLGAPGQGGRGQLTSGTLEASNVDLATELTKIITFQRGYQANAKIITMTDQIMQDTINMKQ